MTLLNIFNTVIILPLKYFFECIFMTANGCTDNPGLSIIVLSLIMNILVLPLYRRADAMQEEERNVEAKLSKGVAHIKKTFKGDEKMMILQTYYRQNHYSPTDVFKGAASLMLEIPFFIAAYQFLSTLDILRGVSFGPISDLGAPDGLLSFGAVTINLLPIIMTTVNLVSCLIFTKNYPRKTKIQLYSMALFFLFFLYDSPAGLVFYWTLNNLFSLVKTIFYKIKNPAKVLSVITTIASVVAFGYAASLDGSVYHIRKPGMIIIGVILLLPLARYIYKPKNNSKAYVPNKKIFYEGAVLLTVLTGLLIPSSVISSSPQEFVNVYYFINPLRYLLSSGCLAAGAFLGWVGVFYALATDRVKTWFEAGIWIICGTAVLNYMCFNISFGSLSNTLTYSSLPSYSTKETIVNMAVVICAALILLVVYLKNKKVIFTVLPICIIAFAGMTAVNMHKINSSVNQLIIASKDRNEGEPSYTLSKNNQNVVVLMLDRSLNQLFPYLIEEKPELREQFAGFTYYPNTISFGPTTNFATPALFGGYEYTPLELNERSDELLANKHNEALKVMPVLFEQNGYDVTIFQPTYANYQWTPDLSIFDEYEGIHAYNTEKRYTNGKVTEAVFETNERNFYFYSLMNISPVWLRPDIYDSGKYKNSYNRFSQSILTVCTAKGQNTSFLGTYSVLQRMTDITDAKETDSNTFLLMTNDTTHNVALLQEPEYIPAEFVDNNSYEPDDYSRTDGMGNKIYLDSINKATHYQSNMAALIEVGKWLDYLRENDVYDNTRIIIVGDHGRNLGFTTDTVEGNTDSSSYKTEYYYPLLLVKDFNSNELKTCEDFMTNADVPTIAVNGIITNPVNPFTGEIINSDEKYAHDQYVIGSDKWRVTENNGTQFLPSVWLGVSGDRRNIQNWKILQTNSVSPFEEKTK